MDKFEFKKTPHYTIKNISFNNGIYTIQYVDDSMPDEEKVVKGKIVANGIYNDNEEKKEKLLANFNFLTEEIEDMKAVPGTTDEVIIPYVELEICPDNDTYIPLGYLRYYIMYHSDLRNNPAPFGLLLAEEVNAPAFQGAIFEKLNWRT